jgi:WD40 repeat protein
VHVAGFVYFPLSLSLHQSGHLLASGCKGFEGVGSEVRIWDLRKLNGQSLIDFKYHNFDVSGCKFSKESPNTLYSASKDGSICAWSCASEEGTECAASPLSALPVTGKSFTCIDIPERSSGVLEASADTIETFFLGAFDGSLSEVSVLKSGGEGAFKLDVSRTSPQHAYEDEHDDGFGD